MKRDYIDAEFEVVGEEKPAKWNGVGLPPEWPVWEPWQRVLYVVLLIAGVAVIYFIARWLAVDVMALPGR